MQAHAGTCRHNEQLDATQLDLGTMVDILDLYQAEQAKWEDHETVSLVSSYPKL
jgi:hypothetical protein